MENFRRTDNSSCLFQVKPALLIQLPPTPISYGANSLATVVQVRYLHSMHPVNVSIPDTLAIQVFVKLRGHLFFDFCF